MSGASDGIGTTAKIVIGLLAGAAVVGNVMYFVLREPVAVDTETETVGETVETAGDPVAGDPPPAPVDGETVQTVTAEPDTTEPGTTAEAPAAVMTQAPTFDQIRVAPDGATVIAGRGPSGGAIDLLLDGAPVGGTRVSGAGDFAAILTLEPSDRPRIMSLRVTTPDGTELEGAETVIIAPFGRTAPETEGADGVAAAAPVAPADLAAEDAAEVAAAPSGIAGAPDTENEIGDTADLGTVSGPGRDSPIEDGAARDGGTAGDGGAAADATQAAGEDGADRGAIAEVDDTEPGGAIVADAPAVSPGTDTLDLAAADTPDGPAPAPSGPQTDVPRVPDTAGAAGETADAAPAGDGVERPEAPSLVMAGPEGVRVLPGDGAAPEALTALRIDAITYTTEGEVALSGRGPADAQVQVLLDNRPIRLGEVGPGGAWSLDLPDVDPGTYTLSVAQLSPEGRVVSRVDTPFLREDPARLAASPMRVDEGVTIITVQPGFTLWGIAEANFGQGIAYVQIFEENTDQIRDPDWIFPGQVFRLPDLPRQGLDD